MIWFFLTIKQLIIHRYHITSNGSLFTLFIFCKDDINSIHN